ncbi:S-adenosyl-L-methionine-dependent methyltransferase [Phyllosticta citribraziliensis]|uniref:S-adenosyl-L-methionine-dependent methyltransferase n=1 Tax=Phyllosticta citribraziliensis TaxID=989973 RepID=A0ABR1LP05_9PEZI
MSFTALAEQILVEAKKIDEHEAAGREISSLATTAGAPNPDNFSVEFKNSRETLINTAGQLLRQSLSPRDFIREKMCTATDILSLQAIYRYDIPTKVDQKTGTTFAQLAAQTGMQEAVLKRILRNAVTTGIFEEKTPGSLNHNATSLCLLDTSFLSFVGFVSEDLINFHMRALDAVEKWPGSQEPNESGFNLAYQTDEPLFNYFEKHPELATRAGKAFRGIHNTTVHSASSLWQEIDRPGAVMVDVGGGFGHIALAIARVTKNLKLIVEDLPGTVEIAAKELPPELKERVSFQAQDFFTEQQVKGADVYFFSKIFHDWGDEYCIRILRSLIPAMKEGARVVINEWVIPEQAKPENAQRFKRFSDLTMLATHNGKERMKEEWKQLFKTADKRFGPVEFTEWPWSDFVHVSAAWNPA